MKYSRSRIFDLPAFSREASFFLKAYVVLSACHGLAFIPVQVPPSARYSYSPHDSLQTRLLPNAPGASPSISMSRKGLRGTLRNLRTWRRLCSWREGRGWSNQRGSHFPVSGATHLVSGRDEMGALSAEGDGAGTITDRQNPASSVGALVGLEHEQGVAPATAKSRARRAMKKVRRRLMEIPEPAADEGRFLLLAAFVGVITGTSGAQPRSRSSGPDILECRFGV